MNKLSQDSIVVKLYHLLTPKSLIIWFISVLFLAIILVFVLNLVSVFVIFLIIDSMWIIVPVVILGKKIEFNSTNIKITYLLPFRKIQEIKYEDVIGFNRWTYPNPDPTILFSNMEEITIFLKNGRIVRVEEYISSKSMTKFKSCLDSYNIFKIDVDRPTFNFRQPYL